MQMKKTRGKKNFKDYISRVIASSTTPQLTYEEFDGFFFSLIFETLKSRDDGLSTEEHKFVTKFAKVMFVNLLDFAHLMACQREPFRKNYCDEYMEWAMMTVEMASRRNIYTSNELLALVKMADNVTRRMLAKDQFVMFSECVINDFTDLEGAIESLYEMISFNLPEHNSSQFDYLFKVEGLHQLTKIVEHNKVTINTWLEWEVERIYGGDI